MFEFLVFFFVFFLFFYFVLTNTSCAFFFNQYKLRFQDEVDAFSVLFHIGRNNGKFVVCIIDDISQQVRLLR